MSPEISVVTAIERLNHLTADEVATLFESIGVTGIRGELAFCPVSRYIYQETGYASRVGFTVARIFTSDDHAYDGSEVVDLPEGVKRFIIRFEYGDFPAIEEILDLTAAPE